MLSIVVMVSAVAPAPKMKDRTITTQETATTINMKQRKSDNHWIRRAHEASKKYMSSLNWTDPSDSLPPELEHCSSPSVHSVLAPNKSASTSPSKSCYTIGRCDYFLLLGICGGL